MEDPQPGFRFYPTEEELVSFYLQNKLEGRRVQDIDRVIPVLDIYDYNPWELPQFAGERCGKDPEQWFFFIPMQEREARGGRPNRLTTEGYWKATGSPGYVYSSNNRIIGGKRTMVFYNGRAPNGRKTQWKMNEYKSIEPTPPKNYSSVPPKMWVLKLTFGISHWVWEQDVIQLRQELSLCRVYIKSKSLRAFDRRPPPQQPRSQLENDDVAFKSHHQNHPLERPSSRGSSSSGNGADENAATHFHAMENGNWIFADDTEPLWDWELLNWF